MLTLPREMLDAIRHHLEAAYPHEGAGLLLGSDVEGGKRITAIYPLENRREPEARHNRYLITPQQMMQGETEALRLGADVVGVFHSHPDHPARPSEYDREWALPFYSYVIVSVESGKATFERSWILKEDRSGFEEEEIVTSVGRRDA